MRSTVFACSLALAALAPAPTQASNNPPTAAAPAAAPAAPTPPPSAVRTLGTVVVSGIRPGPALWKVSRGEHVLWILGTVSPVPKGMQWYSPQSEAVLRQTQEIIDGPRTGMYVGWSSALKVAFAMPTIMRARELPDGKSLRDVLPADLHARWLVLKAAYLGEVKGIEKWRPMFAADKLYGAAVGAAGLQVGTGTGKRLAELAGEYKIKRTSNMINYKITDPKGMAKSLAKADLDEVGCFRGVLDRLDQDVAHAAQRANAWAIGDVAELTRLVRSEHPDNCNQTLAQVPALQAAGMQDAAVRAKAQWIAAVDAALATNAVSFATLPVSELIAADGLLARLRGKGYQVLAPPDRR
jgi:hypothetical protein